MDRRNISDLIQAGETAEVEFKQSFKDSDIKAAIVAFSNDWQRCGGGVILIGISDARAVVGVPDSPNEAQKKASNFANDGSIDPKPQTAVDTIRIQDKLVLIIEVLAGKRPPYRWHGRAYIRVGTSTKPATSEEEQTLTERALSTIPAPLPGWLPPREVIAPDFVGRGRELEQINKWLQDPDMKRCALVGQGGCGKTALAYEFASTARAAPPVPFLDLVLWISAKTRKLAEQGEIPIQPDFWDFDSAVDALLKTAEFEDYVSKDTSTEDRKKALLEILHELPALVVVDDIDTLLTATPDLTKAAAFDFLISTIPYNTRSKVLITSRVDPSIGFSIRVPGFDHKSPEAIEFVDSRLRLFHISPSALTNRQKQELLVQTDGIPLYIEDLLRLYKVTGDYKRSLSDWSGNAGDKAREFALRLEFDKLDARAKTVLLTCSEFPDTISVQDIEKVTNLDNESVRRAVSQLQHLFLLSVPGTASESSFVVNENTRYLIRTVFGDAPQMIRVRAAIRSLRGAVYTSHQMQQVGKYIKEALLQAKARRSDAAEEILQKALNGPFPEHPDLISVLGLVYKLRQPREAERARSCFQRAFHLGSRKAETYRHWAELELQEQNWAGAIKVAEAGLGFLKDDSKEAIRLRYAIGYAKSRLGKSMIDGYNVDAGVGLLQQAHEILQGILKDPRELEPGQWGLRSFVYRALVLNAEIHYRAADDRKLANQIPAWLKGWRREHPEDTRAISEEERLKRRYPNFPWGAEDAVAKHSSPRRPTV